jgi:hypothetical protein
MYSTIWYPNAQSYQKSKIMKQEQNKVANLGIYDMFSVVEPANEMQTTQKEPENTVKIDETEIYENSLEVNILSPSCLNVLRKNYQVDFENGKYLIKW